MVDDNAAEYIRIASLAIAAYEFVVSCLSNLGPQLILYQQLPHNYPCGMAVLSSTALTHLNQVGIFLAQGKVGGLNGKL